MYLIYITAHIRKSNEMNFRLTEAKGHPTYLMMNIKQSLERNNALKMEIFTDKIKQKKNDTQMTKPTTFTTESHSKWETKESNRGKYNATHSKKETEKRIIIAIIIKIKMKLFVIR